MVYSSCISSGYIINMLGLSLDMMSSSTMSVASVDLIYIDA